MYTHVCMHTYIYINNTNIHTYTSTCIHRCQQLRVPLVEIRVTALPASFERRLGHVSSGNHLFSWSHPHDWPIVTLRTTVQLQTGHASPR